MNYDEYIIATYDDPQPHRTGAESEERMNGTLTIGGHWLTAFQRVETPV